MSNQKNDDTLFSSYLDSLYALSHSANTVNTYRSGLNHFKRFVGQNYQTSVVNIIEEFKASKLDPFRILNEFIISLDKLGKKPASIKVWVGVVNGLLRHGGLKIYSEDIKKLVKIPKGHRQREEPLTKEILVRLLRNAPIKLQTAVLVAIASGMRIGEIVQIKISDVDFSSKPTKIKIRSEITKTRESRETYLTAEATNALKDYLMRFFGWNEGKRNDSIMDKLIFGRTSSKGDSDQNKDVWKPRKRLNELRCTPAFVAVSSLGHSLKWHIRNIPELNKLNQNGRRVIHFHAFRKYFRTVTGDATNRDFAEALIGHHFYLDTYYLQTEEKRRELYLKAEPHLTISDFVQVEKDLNKITEKQKELEEEHLVLKRFIEKHFVALPEFEKNHSLIKEDKAKSYKVTCPICREFLGHYNTRDEAKQVSISHRKEKHPLEHDNLASASPVSNHV